MFLILSQDCTITRQPINIQPLRCKCALILSMEVVVVERLRLVGSDGVITISWTDVKVTVNKTSKVPGYRRLGFIRYFYSSTTKRIRKMVQGSLSCSSARRHLNPVRNSALLKIIILTWTITPIFIKVFATKLPLKKMHYSACVLQALR